MKSDKDGASTERLFLELRFGILQGAYLPGEVFERGELGEAFGVNPRGVTAALSTLAAEAYLEYSRKGGFAVKCWSRGEVDDLFDLRASIEGLAAFRAAERATDAEIEYLQGLVQDNSHVSFKDPEEIERITLDGVRFHVEVLRMSKIPSIGELAKNVVPNALHRRIAWTQHCADARESCRMHRKIADDIAARASVRARGRMREDVFSSREKVLAQIEDLARRARPGHKAAIVRFGDCVEVEGRRFGVGRREMGSDGLVTPLGAPLMGA